MANRWSESENQVLAEAKGLLSLVELSERLPGRTPVAIQLQCRKKQIPFRDTRAERAGELNKKWTPELLEELQAQTAVKPLAEVAIGWGLTVGGLRDVMYRHGISGRPKTLRTPEEIEARIAPLRGRIKVDRSVARVCTSCDTEKEASEFREDRNSGNTCISCCNENRRARWHAATDDQKSELISSIRFRKYAMSFDEATALLEAQEYLCSLCSEPLNVAKFHVDHDHACCSGIRSCGKCVRGFVHPRCNILLGYLEWAKSADLIERALNYLDNPPNPSV